MHGHFRIFPQEPLGVLPTLAELVLFVGEPGAALLDHALVHRHIKQAALTGDTFPEHDVELGEPEGGCHLVLGHLGPHPVADVLAPVLDGLDPTHVDPHRGVELEGSSARGGLRRTEHHADLFPQLIDEDACGLGAAEVGGDFAQRLGHETRLQPHMGVAHLSFDFGPRHQSSHRVDDNHIQGS